MLAPARGSSQLPHWMRPIGERLTPIVKALIIVDTLLFLLYLFVAPMRYWVGEYLALGPNLLHGMIWQPVSALFFHVEPAAFAMNMLGLWFVGAGVESQTPRRRFAVLFLVPAILGGLVEVVVGNAVGRASISAGCGASVLSLFVVFGVRHGRAQARILGGLVLEARVFTAILIGFALLVELMGGLLGAAAGTVTTTVVAFFLAGGRVGDVKGMFSRGHAGPSRSRYVVLDGGKGRSVPGGEARGRGEKDDRFIN